MLIAIDIDEVCVPFFNTLAQYHQKKIKKTLRFPLKHKYHYAPLFNLSEDESSALVREFYASSDHLNMKALPGARHVIGKLAAKHDVVAITGRQGYSRQHTDKLMKNLFGNSIDEIYYCDHFTEYEKSKATLCDSMGVNLMIDDSSKICSECLNIGIPVYNFIGNPTYPWCEESSLSVRDWEEIYLRVQSNGGNNRLRL